MDNYDPTQGGLLGGIMQGPGVNPIANANITQAAAFGAANPGITPDAGSVNAIGTPTGAVTLPTMAAGGEGPDMPGATGTSPGSLPQSAIPGQGGTLNSINWSSLAKAVGDPSFTKSLGGLVGQQGAAKGGSMQAPQMVQPPQRQAMPFSMQGMQSFMGGNRTGAY